MFLKNKDKLWAVPVAMQKNGTEWEGHKMRHLYLDECILQWLKQAKDKQSPVSGPMIRVTAEEFVLSLNKEASINSAKERNNITFKRFCGESAGVYEQAADVQKIC